jgi:hypothetical protein
MQMPTKLGPENQKGRKYLGKLGADGCKIQISDL